MHQRLGGGELNIAQDVYLSMSMCCVQKLYAENCMCNLLQYSTVSVWAIIAP